MFIVRSNFDSIVADSVKDAHQLLVFSFRNAKTVLVVCLARQQSGSVDAPKHWNQKDEVSHSHRWSCSMAVLYTTIDYEACYTRIGDFCKRSMQCERKRACLPIRYTYSLHHADEDEGRSTNKPTSCRP